MNSKPLVKNFRDTFGIIDPITGKRYKDIIRSFLLAQYITAEDFRKGYVWHSGLMWRIHCDNHVRRELREQGESRCIVSYQHRTNGLFALCRRFEDERANNILSFEQYQRTKEEGV